MEIGQSRYKTRCLLASVFSSDTAFDRLDHITTSLRLIRTWSSIGPKLTGRDWTSHPVLPYVSSLESPRRLNLWKSEEGSSSQAETR